MRRSIRGFTLVEVIMVLAVMGVATSMGISIFYKAIDAWSVAQTKTNLDAKADRIFSSIRQDVAEVASANVTGASFRVAKMPPMGDSGESDALTVPVLSSANNKSLTDVTYRRVHKESVSFLARIVGDAKREPTENDKVEDGVLAVRFEFLPGGGDIWQADWTQPGLPAAVRVSLLLNDADRPYVKVSRKAVFPVRVY